MVVCIRGGSRADTLREYADLAGVPMKDKELSAEERDRWAPERQQLERDLPAARYLPGGSAQVQVRRVAPDQKGKPP